MQKKVNKEQESIRIENDLALQHIILADVIDLDFLQRFQDDFAKGMGLASVTVDPEGIPVTNPSSYTGFCMDYTQSTECGNKRCAESHRKGGEEAARTGKPVVYECHAGLIDFAAPIMLEDRLIGTILGGQLLTEMPNEAKYRKIAGEIGVDGDGYIEAVKEIRRLSRENIESAANVLFLVANNMSLQYTCVHDSLSGLYNRAFFEQEIKRLETDDCPVGIVICDLDCLKVVNDNLGHSFGDQMIRMAANVITKSCRKEDHVVRLGGDEFAILVSNATLSVLEDIRKRILAIAAKHRRIQPENFIYLSVGFAFKESGGAESLGDIFKIADANMYSHKVINKQYAQKEILEKISCVNSEILGIRPIA